MARTPDNHLSPRPCATRIQEQHYVPSEENGPFLKKMATIYKAPEQKKAVNPLAPKDASAAQVSSVLHPRKI